ncbi:hypothetical protein Y1Q_0017230 [Alligator mississippiensis]|uniref:Uncharacterized protein n=1 Tax=Alligator mississippiensis TaxID=8496 RepID=A0A151NLQ4_ALLMI|nr:hypothetical protein Y1Q_0017230 [Alligator mississippiensis]
MGSQGSEITFPCPELSQKEAIVGADQEDRILSVQWDHLEIEKTDNAIPVLEGNGIHAALLFMPKLEDKTTVALLMKGSLLFGTKLQQ